MSQIKVMTFTNSIGLVKNEVKATVLAHTAIDIPPLFAFVSVKLISEIWQANHFAFVGVKLISEIWQANHFAFASVKPISEIFQKYFRNISEIWQANQVKLSLFCARPFPIQKNGPATALKGDYAHAGVSESAVRRISY